MHRFGFATLNHSPLHGLSSQWEAHLDAAATAGFRAIAPDVFWLRAIEAEGIALDRLAAAFADRGLECMEIAGIAIGDPGETERELEEHVRYARALRAEFVNARVTRPIDAARIHLARDCAFRLREDGADREGGTRLALEFSRGTQCNGIADGQRLVESIGVEGVGVTLDTWHFFLHPDGPDWAALDALPLAQLANVQLSDGIQYEEGAFGEATMNGRLLPGAGDFDLPRFWDALDRKGFDGAVVLEVLNAQERESPVAKFAERLFACVQDRARQDSLRSSSRVRRPLRA